MAAVPGSSFYKTPSVGRTKLRFCFCKKDETLRRLTAGWKAGAGGVTFTEVEN